MHMMEMIKIERKRVLSIRSFLIFLILISSFSAYSAYSALGRYSVPNENGIAITWRENLAHAKINQQDKAINREFLSFMRQQEEFTFVDEINLEELVAANYEGKSVRNLSDEEISSFYAKRLCHIRMMLKESQRIHYTEKETEKFMQSAAQISEIKFGYAEGWKVLQDDMEVFIPALLILISVLLFPLFGTDSKSSMKELYRSTKLGKTTLDHARILTAYIIGVFLYGTGVFLFFVIKIMPFGIEGWNQCIQSNADTLFSFYNITNLQQFFINVMIGLAALLFVVSLLLFLTVFMERIMTSAIVFVFFWILLLLFDQMHLWEINHYFANFMPLRMTAFSHYYVSNEIYRVFGYSISCMAWNILVTGVLTGMMLAAIGCKIGWGKKTCNLNYPMLLFIRKR